MLRPGSVVTGFVGLLVLLSALTQFGPLPRAIQAAWVGMLGAGPLVLYSLIADVGTVLLGVCCILARDKLGQWLFGDELPFPRDLLRAATGGVGLFLIMVAIPRVVGALISGVVAAQQVAGSSTSGISLFAVTPYGTRGMTWIVGIVIGIPLVFVSRRMGGFSVVRRQERASTQSACPSCGAVFDPADYRDGAEKRCSRCHSMLEPDA